MKYYICLELGGTNLRYGIVDKSFEVREFYKISTKGLAKASDKIAYLKKLFQILLDEYGIENIICISMALPSLMNRERTTIFTSPMVSGFENMPIVSLMENAFKLPVIIEKDVNILLLYEIWKKRLSKSGISVGVFLGTGIGNAMCINGEIYKGSSGTACELGHIPVPYLDKECGCGKKGCIELMGCGKLLHNLAATKLNCEVSEVFLKYNTDIEVKNILYYLSISVATEITILDPEVVILGGGIVEMDGFPLELFVKMIKDNLRIPNPRDNLNITLASGDSKAGIIGCAINASQILK